MKKSNQALIIFARKPELGKAKTRLAATVGNKKALEIYFRLLTHTKLITENLPCDKYVFLTHEQDDNFWNGFNAEIQKDETLGEKMQHAFSLLFKKGYENVLIIGTDCPGITTEIVADGFKKLKTQDVVIGPAEDGGYYLLGMNKLQTDLFKDISWSSERVRQQTIDKLKKQNLTHSLLPTLNDVDEEKDVPQGWL